MSMLGLKIGKHARTNGSPGFTLVEIMVALALTGLVMTTIYKAMSGQQKIYSVQDQTVEMQENLRAATDMMIRDLRMAGCDPQGKSNATVLTATANTVRFTMDQAGGPGGTGLATFADGVTDDPNEDITYSLMNDTDNILCIGRKDGTGAFSPVARDVEANGLEFFYTLADGTQTLNPTDPATVRMVQITILAKNSHQDKDFKNRSTYTLPSGNTRGPYNDGYRRRLMTSVVRLRNMGFK